MRVYYKTYISFFFLIGALFLAGCAKEDKASSSLQSTSTAGDEEITTNVSVSAQTVGWEFSGDTWRASGNPPLCAQSLVLPAPVDLTRVTGILYPGQARGGNYKPHGGFRFDGGNGNQVSVRAPMDAQVWRGARYIEQGEVQYLFDFMSSCGILYRFDHLRTLSSKFQALAEQFPEAAVDDSRTNIINMPVFVSVGEEIATEVGFVKNQNVSVDFGLYDLRSKNQSGQDASWAEEHGKELAPYGVCWFDWLNAADAARVRSLPPADQTSGVQSDYCH